MVRWGTPEPQGVKLLATLKDINGKTVSKENVIITVVDEIRTLLKGCHKTDNPNTLMNVTGETMMKAKLFSLKYEKYLPVEFWQSVLHEEKNHYYQFLVDNLFNKI